MGGTAIRFAAWGAACVVALGIAVRAEPPPEGPGDEPAFTTVFGEDTADFATSGTNPWLVLEPGYVLEYEGLEKDGTQVRLKITVLEETKKVGGVETRIVEEREWEDGELIEISRNYLAISRRTNAVYYFGEDVDMYRGGKLVSHDGAWLSGVKGAKYGMLMPGTPLLGARYHQETAPGLAMDRGEVVSLTSKCTTPLGKFTDVLKIEETTPLEPGNKEYKYYARGIGMLRDGPNRLVKYGKPERK
jgi:hypothetical protein